MTGLKKLMEELGVKDFKELTEYINNPLNQEKEIVKELKELFKIYIESQAQVGD